MDPGQTPPPDVHAGDQWSGDMCRIECQLEVTAGDHAGDGEYCPGRLRTRGDGVLATVNFMQGPVLEVNQNVALDAFQTQ